MSAVNAPSTRVLSTGDALLWLVAVVETAPA
ncbi:hypothetical protein SAMN04489812_4741 [Microlunatus soli]|uniref:Uncharacterized protein n=1 Tax=Microlunatus soli TaxID=630515 RepID=A0A1H1YS70_9ACTN|nr:hypothetical protein SAMN04489812_4741 [Microlunatus soli]